MHHFGLNQRLLARIGLSLKCGVRLKLALDQHTLIGATRDVEIQLINFIRLIFPRHRITRILDDRVLLLSVVIAWTHDVCIVVKIRRNHAIVLFYFNLCRRLIIIHALTLGTGLSISPQSGSSIDIFGYLDLRCGTSLLLNILLIFLIIVNLFSVGKIFNILVIVHLLDLIRTHLLEVQIPPKKSLIIIVLISLENLINLILLNRIIFFAHLLCFVLKILLEVLKVLVVLYILLLPILILLISVIVLILLFELLFQRHHLLLLLRLIILILIARWQSTHHLHFESLFFHQELIFCDLLVDLGFEVLFFAVDKAHIVIFLDQVHIANIKGLNLINIHLGVLLQIIILIILAIDILV